MSTIKFFVSDLHNLCDKYKLSLAIPVGICTREEVKKVFFYSGSDILLSGFHKGFTFAFS